MSINFSPRGEKLRRKNSTSGRGCKWTFVDYTKISRDRARGWSQRRKKTLQWETASISFSPLCSRPRRECTRLIISKPSSNGSAKPGPFIIADTFGSGNKRTVFRKEARGRAVRRSDEDEQSSLAKIPVGNNAGRARHRAWNMERKDLWHASLRGPICRVRNAT